MSTTKKIISDFKSMLPPGEAIQFLFEIQTSLLGYGHFAIYTDKGAQEAAMKFACLFELLKAIDETK